MTKAQATKALDAELAKHDLTTKQKTTVRRAAAPLLGVVDWATLLALIMAIIEAFRKK